MLVLAEKLTEIHASLYDYEPRVSTEDMADFIRIEYSRVGAKELITPREIIRDWIEILNILYQNPSSTVSSIFESGGFSFASPDTGERDDNYAEFEF